MTFLSVRLPPTAAAEHRAREALRRAAGSRLASTALIDVLLVASELVSNAVQHADVAPDDRILLRFWCGRSLRIEVEHRGSGRTPMVAAGVAGERPPLVSGLGLVTSASDNCGFADDGHALVAWAEIAGAGHPCGPPSDRTESRFISPNP